MTAIEKDLQFLYGDALAQRLAARLLKITERFSAARKPRDANRNGRWLTERDALVISYGDQLQASGEAPLRTLSDFLAARLAGVVSGVHLLPFYPSSSDDGFAVKDFFEVDPVLGTWADVANIGESFDLMMDAVFNHMSASSGWFQRFLEGTPKYRDFFITVKGEPDLSQVVRPRALPLLTKFSTAAGEQEVWTTFSADQVDLNFKNPEVLLAIVDALLFYAAQGARFIRLDAIAYLWKEIGTACIHLPQTHRVVQLLRRALDAAAPDVLLITETNVPHADNLSYFGDGTNEAQMVYNFALPPLVLHTLATGNASHLTRWTSELRLPSDRVTFFNFLASHDGIGVNPARGILSEPEIASLIQRAQDHGGYVSWKHNSDGSKSPYELNINYFDALSNPDDAAEPIETQVNRFLAAQAIMLALAGVPGIYFHSLFGSRNDRAGAEASGIPRRINRQKLRRVDLEHDLADPASLRSRVFSRFKHLLEIRRAQPAFHPSAPQQVLTLDSRVFGLVRQTPDGAQRILCLHNVANETVQVTVKLRGSANRSANVPVRSNVPPLKLHEIAKGSHWRDLLDPEKLAASTAEELQISLAPYQVVWALQDQDA